jgi:DNA polymerase-4
MADQPRAIIHLDLDAFYACVEVLENPELAGKPVIVGGRPGGRGVVLSATYPARAHGVRSGMPSSRAVSLCPSAIFVPPRHSLYGQYSRRVMEVLRQTSPLVEQMSIDEAYLDVTDQIAAWDDAIEIAAGLQRRVERDVRLSASLGVAANKLLAKIASDRDKPGGLTVVRPGSEEEFLAPLPVRVLWGVGPVMARNLAEMGITTVGGLAAIPPDDLEKRFGRNGRWLAHQARGEDSRAVSTEREIKSVSSERTFRHDLTDPAALDEQLAKLSHRVSRNLERKGLVAATVAVKIRYSDFSTLTRQMTLAVPSSAEQVIHQAATTLFHRAWQRGRPVRLLGVAARRLSPPAGQLPLL